MNEESRDIAKKYLSAQDFNKLMEEQRRKDHYLTDAIKEEQKRLFRKAGKAKDIPERMEHGVSNKDIVVLNRGGKIIRTFHTIQAFMSEYGKNARIELSNSKPYRIRLHGGLFAQFKCFHEQGERRIYDESLKKWTERAITPVLQVDGDGNVIQEFGSLNEAMRAFRCGNKVMTNRPYITYYPRRGIYLQCKEDYEKGHRFK